MNAPTPPAPPVIQHLILCRCEDVTLAAVDVALEAGADSLDEVKQWTRLGMGACQGRTCLPLLALYLRGKVSGSARPAWRWPVRPVAMGELARPLPEPPEDQMGLMELDLAAWRASREAGEG